jgi:ubiquitin-conjugating enzyme E2 Z
MTSLCDKRLMRELAQRDSLRVITLQSRIKFHADYLFRPEANHRHLSVLLVGPPDTPYCRAPFRLALTVPDLYPTEPPQALWGTTDAGRARFGPNLYSNGKVCLSILGTFSGPSWAPSMRIETVLTSVRSLLHSTPYLNEPGFETAAEAVHVQRYGQKILHESIRVAVLQTLLTAGPNKSSTPDPLYKVAEACFLLYYSSYRRACTAPQNTALDGQAFTMAPFEYEANKMAGAYAFAAMVPRIDALWAALAHETECWALGRDETGHERRAADAEFAALRDEFGASGVARLSVDPSRPRAWLVTPTRRLFEGAPEALWGAAAADPGLQPPSFSVVFPPRYFSACEASTPYPRVRFGVRWQHPAVSEQGVPYVPWAEGANHARHVLTCVLALLRNNCDLEPDMWVNEQLYDAWKAVPQISNEEALKQMVLRSFGSPGVRPAGLVSVPQSWAADAVNHTAGSSSSSSASTTSASGSGSGSGNSSTGNKDQDADLNVPVAKKRRY